MHRPHFTSIFAKEINAYLDYQESSGKKLVSFCSKLQKFDRFCAEEKIDKPEFSAENASKWLIKNDLEASTTYYSRINCTKRFLEYLSTKGYDIFVIRDVKFISTGFTPHIYSDDEIRRYFVAVDSFSSAKNLKNNIQYPVLFRLIYSCGSRINETLGIRKCDVDLDDGIIKLHETKNGRERFIVLSSDMKCLMEQFANKCFYLLADDGYIFTSMNNSRLDGSTIYKVHREFLLRARIPYFGNGSGPRIHDWRHTMAVKSFKQMIDNGIDMYVALPIISTYLGHKTIYATERYVRLVMSMYPYIEERFGAKMDAVFREITSFEKD
jgi:integrase